MPLGGSFDPGCYIPKTHRNLLKQFGILTHPVSKLVFRKEAMTLANPTFYGAIMLGKLIDALFV
jgi:hypothetical protein